MIHVVAKSYVKKENQATFIELAKKMVAHTVTEKGCIQYILVKAKDVEDVFFFVEKWETLEDLDAHSNGEYLNTIIEEVKKVRYERDVTICEEI